MSVPGSDKDVVRMEAEFKNIKELLLEVRDDIKNLNQTYVPRNEINVLFEQRDNKIAQLQTDVAEIRAEQKESKKNIPAWISSIVAILALLIAYFK